MYLRGGDNDCTKDDEEYEGWVVKYYPAESPSDPGPSGFGVEWTLWGELREMGRAASLSSGFLNDF